MVILGMRLVCPATNLKCSIMGWPENPSLPVTCTPSLRVVTAANAMPVSMLWRSAPSSPQRKSRCHQERRNSPSVTACRPTSSCFLMTRSISRSSTALRSAALISPLARFSRACFNDAGRRRLPTWSARNGGLVRFMVLLRLSRRHARESGPPYSRSHDVRHHGSPLSRGRHRARPILSSPDLVGDLHDPPQLRPLLVLGQDIAFLGGGEAALRREAELVEVDVPRGLVDAALELVLGFERPALRGDEPEHDHLALGHETQRREAAGAVAVVFHEIGVDVDLVEQNFGHRLVAAGRDESRLEVAAGKGAPPRHHGA